MAQYAKPVIVENNGEDDYRAFFNSDVFRVWHLKGRERTFRIVQVKRIDSVFRGEQRKQPLLFLSDSRNRVYPLPLALNKTNAKTIAGLYGTRTSEWVGKTITLFPTTTQVGEEQNVECIRVRPVVPGTNVERGKNRNGATVLRQLPANTVADAEFEAESVREPGDDTDEVENVIR